MFFVLNWPTPSVWNNVYGTIGGEGYPQPIWEITHCRQCGRSLTCKQINNLRMELFGQELLQIVWTDVAPLFSDPLVQALTSSNLHGFTFRPVDIVAWWKANPSTNEIENVLLWEDAPILHQLLPVGAGVSILNHNRVKVSILCTECKAEKYSLLDHGIIIDKSQWNGSDLFTVKEYPALLIITERFVQWLSQNRIGNYEVIHTSDFSFSKLAG